MNEADIRRLCRCGACRGRIGRRINLVSLGRKATWEYPSAGNVLTGASGEAVAVVCDGCIDDKRDIVEAVEFREGAPVYHPVDELEKIPETVPG